MKRRKRSDELARMAFALNKEGVQFRNKWRSLVGMSIWLVLSGITMILTILSVTSQIHAAIVIAMSLLKYIPLLMVVYSLSRKMAARYLDDIFELHDEELASRFLEDVTFGGIHESITINEGRISAMDEKSPLILIGGPGSIQVNLDSVALLEEVDGMPQVIHPRSEPWKLGMFERIREIGRNDEVGKREYAIINLRDQFVSGLSVKSRTKDGIPIEAQDIKVIFSILRRQHPEEKDVQGDAYLFEPGAVEALVYNQTLITPEPVTPSGINFPWDTSVIPLIYSELEDLITSRTLSEILATIGQKEVDESSTNDQTIARMRVEMTGQTFTAARKNLDAPKFQSRSKITARFYNQAFKEKAARLGVSIEWIDIGTWRLPSSIILDKHKEAWALSRENAKKNASIERSKKRHEMEEILSLVDSVVIANFEKPGLTRKLTEREMTSILAKNPGLTADYVLQEINKKDAKTIAQEMLKAFRKELIAAKDHIEKEGRSQMEKNGELASIEKALYDINHILPHWVNR